MRYDVPRLLWTSLPITLALVNWWRLKSGYLLSYCALASQSDQNQLFLHHSDAPVVKHRMYACINIPPWGVVQS